MTLCIICECDRNSAGEPVAYSLADTLVTVTGPRSSSGVFAEKAALPRFLPENIEIRHQTEYGVKTYPILQKSVLGDVQLRPLVFCIAGAVALGLHSLIHLEARLTGTPLKGSLDELLNFITSTLQGFWDSAYDKEIEYLFAVTDNNQLHLYKIIGDKNSFKLSEVPRIQGLLFGVIGDGIEDVEQQILQETQSICTAGVAAMPALFAACVRALKRSIEDPSIKTIGGGIQSCMINGSEAKNVLVCVAQGKCYYRGAKISGGLPHNMGDFGLGATGSQVLLLTPIRYDPHVSIEDIVKRFNE